MLQTAPSTASACRASVPGAELLVSLGGAALATQVHSGATDVASAGGGVSSTTVSSGGMEIVQAGGVAQATPLHGFATQLVDGGTASGGYVALLSPATEQELPAHLT